MGAAEVGGEIGAVVDEGLHALEKGVGQLDAREGDGGELGGHAVGVAHAHDGGVVGGLARAVASGESRIDERDGGAGIDKEAPGLAAAGARLDEEKVTHDRARDLDETGIEFGATGFWAAAGGATGG